MSSYQLTVPNTIESVSVAEAFIHRVSASQGLAARDVSRLTKAIGLAVEFAILFAYPEAREDQITLECTSGSTLQVTVHDNGVPELPGHSGDALKTSFENRLEAALEGYEHQWRLLGYRGKELSVLVPVTRHSVTAAAVRVSSGSEPTASELYDIRRLRPQDAPQVSRLVYRTYGHTYDDEDYYYPEKIVAENDTGAMVSVVAVHPSGEVVGHYALEQREPETIYEGSSAVVNAEHRGKGLMERMRGFATEEGRRLGFTGLMFLPWTIHTVSQKANERFGAKLCAANLSDTSPVAIRGYEDESLAQRASTLLYFMPLHPLDAKTVYAPDRHRDMLSRIYGQLGRPISFGTAADGAGPSSFTTASLPHDRFTELRFIHIGEDFEHVLAHELREQTLHHGCETVYLNLPLSQPATASACRIAEDRGFSFLGIGPCFADDGDTLRMAFLAEQLDPDHIHVLSDFGKQLVAYCLSEAIRVA